MNTSTVILLSLAVVGGYFYLQRRGRQQGTVPPEAVAASRGAPVPAPEGLTVQATFNTKRIWD